MKGVETPDDWTVAYDLSGVNDREMPLTLALMPVLSAPTPTLNISRTSLEIPLGSGPYVTEVEPGERLMLTRNPDYWAKDQPISRGLYNFDQIRIEYYRDANALFEAFKAGLVDYRVEDDPNRWLYDYSFPAVRTAGLSRRLSRAGCRRGSRASPSTPAGPCSRIPGCARRWHRCSTSSGSTPICTPAPTPLERVLRRVRPVVDRPPGIDRERTLLAPFPGAVRDNLMDGAGPPQSTTARGATGRSRDARSTSSSGPAMRSKTAVSSTPAASRSASKSWSGTATRSDSRSIIPDLGRIGVAANVRLVDEVQYQRRRQRFDFDMMIGTWIASASPGDEQRAAGDRAAARPRKLVQSRRREVAGDRCNDRRLTGRPNAERISSPPYAPTIGFSSRASISCLFLCLRAVDRLFVETRPPRDDAAVRDRAIRLVASRGVNA